MWKWGAVVVLGLVIGGLPARAQTNIFEGEMAVIRFSFSGAPQPLNPPANLLYFSVAAGTSPLLGVTYRLYDGDTLLGSHLHTGDMAASGQSFISASNPYSTLLSEPSVVVDFSRILSGTIDGRIEYQPVFATPGPGNSVTAFFSLSLFDQVDPDGGLERTAPTINSVNVVAAVPEPGTWVLVIGGVALLLGQRFVKRHARRGLAVGL